LIFLSYFLRHL